MNKMYKSIIFFLVFTTTKVANAQWLDTSNNTKNAEWNYSFGSVKDVLKAEDGLTIEKKSTKADATFLPSPLFGEVKVSMFKTESGQEKSSFKLNGDQSLTMVHTSGNGVTPSPTKFVAKIPDFNSKVLNLELDFKLMNASNNKTAVWYLAIGSHGAGVINAAASSPSISAGSATDHVFTVLRIRKYGTGNTYTLQARANVNPQADRNPTFWVWVNVATGIVADKDYKINIYCNNTNNTVNYLNGTSEVSLESATYHVYLNNERKAVNLSSLTRNVGTDSYVPYTGNLNGFSIMSREGANSFASADHSNIAPVNADNSASIILKNIKLVGVVNK